MFTAIVHALATFLSHALNALLSSSLSLNTVTFFTICIICIYMYWACVLYFVVLVDQSNEGLELPCVSNNVFITAFPFSSAPIVYSICRFNAPEIDTYFLFIIHFHVTYIIYYEHTEEKYSCGREVNPCYS